jgi:hypothetical protein
MNILLFTLVVLPVLTGIASIVYMDILGTEIILNWWFRVGARFEKKWFFKPVWGCQKCFAGQLCLWLGLAFNFSPILRSFTGFFAPGWLNIPFAGLMVLFGALNASFFTLVLHSILQKYRIL